MAILTRRIFKAHTADDLMRGNVMAKLNVSIDEQVREELFRLVPPRRRSQVVNEALRKELLRRKRGHVTQTLRGLRKRSTTMSGEEIVATVRRDRKRVGE
jgi:metal-responsive CopG/Arc/MetJ family transcriptional regulator